MPKRAKGTAYHYRDTRTGRFVPKSTWKRSKAQGGKRYKRENQKPREEEKEYSVNVEYATRKRINNVEVQVIAKGPSGQSRKQVLDAVNTRMETGKNPTGWKVNAIVWKKASEKYKDNGNEEQTWKAIKKLVTGGGKVSLERRSRH